MGSCQCRASSVLPPIVAIVLALITKEVVFSLVLGILSGTVIYSFAHGDGFVGIFDTTTTLMGDKLAENTSMIYFCVCWAFWSRLSIKLEDQRHTENGR